MMNWKKLKFIFIALLVIICTCISVEAASINRKKASILVTKTVQLKIKGTSSKVTWKSSNKKIASVSSKGLVKGKKPGTAVITARVNGKSYKCKVTVKAGISLSKMSMYTGEIKKLKLLGTSIKAAKSSNKSVATVTKAGVVKALGVGQTKITLTGKNKKKYTCKVTVKRKPGSKAAVVPTSIRIASPVTISVGAKVKLKVSFTPSNVSNKSLTWKSENSSVATVSEGTVTGIKAGKSIIRATTHNGKTAECEVIVQEKTSVIEASSLEAFSKAVSNLIKNNKVQNGNSAYSNDEFYSKRLIMKTNGSAISLDRYSPTSVVKGLDYYYVLQFSTIDSAKQAWGELSNNPAVIYIEPDAFCEGSSTDSASGNGFYSWGVQKVYADKYAKSIANVKGQVVVAVVDSGVSKHQFLDGRILPGFDFVDGDDNTGDLNGHGTHVAGTIVDCTPGLNIKIRPVRVLDINGNGFHSTVGLGILYAAETGADVVNLSLGGPHSNFKDEMVNYCIKKGITVVAAAGNDHGDTRKVCPAHIEGAIVVGSVDENLSKATLSNVGASIDLVAPGEKIVSCIPGNKYMELSGTSMATAHVSAAAAMLLYENKGLSPAEVETKLRNAATDLGKSGWDSKYGAGFLNLSSFVKGLKEYTINYDANGGTGAPSAQKKVSGETLTISSIQPEKSCTVTFNDGTGKTEPRIVKMSFDGWNTAADGSGTSYSPKGTYSQDASVTLYAQWKAASLGTLPTPTRDGYELDGWYTAATGGEQISESETVIKDVTYYAHWSQDTEPKTKYTITYDANGGSEAPSAQTKVEGKTLKLSTSVPVKSYNILFHDADGHVEDTNMTVDVPFLNWNTKADGSGTAYNSGSDYAIESSVTLYAQWGSATVGSLPTPPAREGYRFSGWYTTYATSSGIQISESTLVTKDTTYYARWEKTYILSFDAMGGTGAPPALELTDGEEFTIPETEPTPSPFTVTFDNNDGTEARSSKEVYGSFTYWTTGKSSGSVFYSGKTYTFSRPKFSNESEVCTLYAQYDSATVGPLPTLIKTGYVLLGWYLDASSTSSTYTINATTKVKKDITYYAHWRKQEYYTIAYNANGGTGAPASQTKDEGTDITLRTTIPQKTNTVTFDYGTGKTTSIEVTATFDHWNTTIQDSGTYYMPGGIYSKDTAVTLYAQWIPSRVGTLPEASREDYSFEGWFTSEYGGIQISGEEPVTKDITYYAHWTKL